MFQLMGLIVAALAMAVPSPAEGASKWGQRLAASGEQVRAGIRRVTRSPGEAAAASAELWHRRVTASTDKFRRKVGAVTLQDWQGAMESTGVSRMVEGATAKQGKYQSFADKFYPVAQQVSDRVKAMPKGDLEQSLARVREAMTTFRQFGQTGRS
jgi:hypothetical protein